MMQSMQGIYTTIQRVAIGAMLVLFLALFMGPPAQAQTQHIRTLQPGERFQTAERVLGYDIINQSTTATVHYEADLDIVSLDNSLGPRERHSIAFIFNTPTSIQNKSSSTVPLSVVIIK